MKLAPLFFTAACLASTLRAAEADLELSLPKEKKFGGLQFNVLPKTFQKNPELDFNFITEMTADGKKLPKPSARQPIYYIATPGKFTPMGEAPANEHPPPLADLLRAMQKALATNGYVASTEGGPPPRLAVFFNFGSFARFSTGADDANAEAVAIQDYNNALDAQSRGRELGILNPSAAPSGGTPTPPETAVLINDSADQLLPYVMSDVAKRREVLERATLVAGARFAQELGEAIEAEIQHRQTGLRVGGDKAYDPASPFNRFRDRNPKLMYFVEESFSSCYFVIASAYDYAALGKGNRVLLWRTKMTVNSLGISMTESLPALIVSAGPYLGRPMNEAAVISRKISREGKVEIGTPTVVEEKP